MWPQGGGEDAYKAQRRKASELFSQGKRLEALPILEELVKTNPRDEEMAVELAACLVDHAATLTDSAAAARVRFRARDILERSGSTTPLAQNLLQLLRQLPENGAIKFSDNPAVDRLMRAGEAAFSRRDFDEAIKDYSKALEMEPGNYSAALFIGNTFDKKSDFAKAAEWYERTIKLDPNIETAYRYYADMLAKEGDMARARTLLIGAAVAEPYNRIVWRELQAWATINKTEINFVYVSVPPLPKGDQPQDVRLDPDRPPEVSAAWRAYHAVKARWQQDDEFRKHDPQKAEYRHSLSEESEALTAAAGVLQKLKDDPKTATMVTSDPALMLLLKLHQSGLIESYVLFSLGDTGIAQDYAAYRARHRDKLERYLDEFVLPPASVRP